MKPIFCTGSSKRDGPSTGRSPTSSERSATRAERFPERTAENVARASTRVPAAVASEAMVVMVTESRASTAESVRSPRRSGWRPRLCAARGRAQTCTLVSSIDELLARERSTLVRLDPLQAAEAARRGGLLVDTRPVEQRPPDRQIPGAPVGDRHLLE